VRTKPHLGKVETTVNKEDVTIFLAFVFQNLPCIRYHSHVLDKKTIANKLNYHRN